MIYSRVKHLVGSAEELEKIFERDSEKGRN